MEEEEGGICRRSPTPSAPLPPGIACSFPPGGCGIGYRGEGGVVRKNPGNEPQGQEEEVEREPQGCLLVLLGV